MPVDVSGTASPQAMPHSVTTSQLRTAGSGFSTPLAVVASRSLRGTLQNLHLSTKMAPYFIPQNLSVTLEIPNYVLT